jgi:hypothetical protein
MVIIGSQVFLSIAIGHGSRLEMISKIMIEHGSKTGSLQTKVIYCRASEAKDAGYFAIH